MPGKLKLDKQFTKMIGMLGDANKIITPDLTRFLLDNPNIVYEQWVVDRIAEQLAKKPRVRSSTFSASAAGTCPRKQVLSFIGSPGRQSDDIQLANMANDGTWRHLRLQANLLQAGIVDDIEYGVPWPARRAMGTLDCVMTVPQTASRVDWRGLSAGVELKGAYSFKAWKIQAEGPQVYLPQVRRYFASTALDLFVILIENRDSLEWQEYVYERAGVDVQGSLDELDELNGHVDAQTLPVPLPDCARHIGTVFNHQCQYGGKGGICATASTWAEAQP